MCAECLEETHAGVIYGLHTGDYDFRYIGKSINHKRRHEAHVYAATRGGGYAVHNWIRKHGAEKIQMTIIETFDEETIGLMDEREIFHIAQARAYYGKNMNLTDGGEGASGWTASHETKAKMSAAKLGIKRSAEARAILSAAQGLGQHTRWHTNRGLTKPECRFCTNANESQ